MLKKINICLSICVFLLLNTLLLSACAERNSTQSTLTGQTVTAPCNDKNAPCYKQNGKHYKVLSSSKNYSEKGTASWYGRKFNKKRTSSGERFNMYRMTAAHKTLPLSTYVQVTNLRNGKQVIVKVND